MRNSPARIEARDLDAMRWYEEAQATRAPGNDDAVLRWNACARLIMRDHHLVPVTEERSDLLLLE